MNIQQVVNILPPDIMDEDGRGGLDDFVEDYCEPTENYEESIEEIPVKKSEFSKKLCIAAVIIFTGVAIYSIFAYYYLMQLAIELQSCVIPDASLPIAAVTSILAAILSYCLYQMGLKTSRNKYGIDSNGQPFK